VTLLSDAPIANRNDALVIAACDDAALNRSIRDRLGVRTVCAVVRRQVEGVPASGVKAYAPRER
jgi:hypothetical protein